MSKSQRTQEHFVAPVDSAGLPETDAVQDGKAPLSMWGEAWRNLRRRPLFIISAFLILLIITVAAFPQLFTQIPADGACYLADSNAGPAPGHPLGFTLQGCDVYTRLIYGTRASLLVGVITTACVVLLGGSLGALAGYYGGWLDAVIARLGDIFFALPLILGAIIVMQLPMFRENRNILTVVVTLVVFGWPQIARITRGAVISVRNADFVVASRALGVSKFQALVKHVVPNALAPVIVTATISLGTFIVAEATLSFLGIGLPPDIMSWGNDISAAQTSLRANPAALLWPAGALSVTVLSFIMLGDAVRDALDPKARKL
ncbi:ABC transporter permease [Arthrobacter caoxuetaonis]|uniref:ABC transporter permease n=1 Tax=Arthrobacter caoxuetaonis TaxID=2886935 RepID=A0A9X1MCF1_9MICC|nr:ABC transporter permease [Arthrobacter caoxuetaonis]MCC3296670.1 ABC transporter permease [Arthrobacter caoxuetaonis]USQ56504.1 ABC transporter permease [Arthrobacter caoxuetaonis]